MILILMVNNFVGMDGHSSHSQFYAYGLYLNPNLCWSWLGCFSDWILWMEICTREPRTTQSLTFTTHGALYHGCQPLAMGWARTWNWEWSKVKGWFGLPWLAIWLIVNWPIFADNFCMSANFWSNPAAYFQDFDSKCCKKLFHMVFAIKFHKPQTGWGTCKIFRWVYFENLNE